jgi:hypothetical protein
MASLRLPSTPLLNVDTEAKASDSAVELDE